MARPGINYQDVEAAATALQTGGQNPTVDRVRDYLGSGSKSTIAPLLKQWREKNNEEHYLPDHLQKAVAALYNTLQAEANEKIAQAEQTNNKVLAELKQQKDLLEKQAIEGIEKITELEAALSQEREQSKEKTGKIQTLEIAATESAAQLKQKELQLEDKHQALLSQQQQNKHLTKSFDHYQQQAAHQREQDRADFADRKQQLEAQLSRLTLQQQQLNAELHETLTTKNLLTEANITQLKKLESLENTIANQMATIKNIKEENQRLSLQLNDEKQLTSTLKIMDKNQAQQTKQLEASIMALENQNLNHLKIQDQLQTLLSSQQDSIHSLQKQLTQNEKT